MKRVFQGGAALLAALVGSWCLPGPGGAPEPGSAPAPEPVAAAGLGDPAKVRAAYGRWATAHEARGGDRDVAIALGWSKALSAEHTRAVGQAHLDLERRSIAVEVRGLARPEEAEVWLVDNQPVDGDTVAPERHDRKVRLGRLVAKGNDVARLETALGAGLDEGFEVDLVVVARPAADPAGNVVLTGAPTLFQRLYTRSRAARPPASPIFFGVGPRAVEADADTDPFDPVVALGRDLFFNGTFNGNGRTCGTCHPAENNLTIDPAFIRRLPRTDPLFVAEFVPALARNFENPVLMRKLGLILENLDGFGDLENRFAMRGVPHTIGMQVSLTPPAFLFDGTTLPPNQRTGWSGDGAPGGGTLRDFATGAVTQHFPLTLNRMNGADFTLPNDLQLDAMEAFQLGIGRDAELDIVAMVFRNPSVAAGRNTFNSNEAMGGGKCGQCHANAGANTPGPGGGNANFATGVESTRPADDIDQPPIDNGFGFPGNGSFNTVSLVEAADSGPFFHNHRSETIEDAVQFYTTPDFANSPSGAFIGPIVLDRRQIRNVGAFLRAINALENIRQAREDLLAHVDDAPNAAAARGLLRLANEEIADAARVLGERGLHPRAVAHLLSASAFVRLAILAPNAVLRNVLRDLADRQLAAARADVVVE